MTLQGSIIILLNFVVLIVAFFIIWLFLGELAGITTTHKGEDE